MTEMFRAGERRDLVSAAMMAYYWDIAARAHRAIAGSEAVVIPGGPHSVNVTHPRQFNRALLDFLAS